MQGRSYYNQGWGKAFSVYRTAPNLFIARISPTWRSMGEAEEKRFRTFDLAKAYIKSKENECRKKSR